MEFDKIWKFFLLFILFEFFGLFNEKKKVFSNSAVSEACLSERAQKMLPNEPLDVKKFVELAENEPLQTQALTTGSLGVTWPLLLS